MGGGVGGISRVERQFALNPPLTFAGNFVLFLESYIREEIGMGGGVGGY